MTDQEFANSVTHELANILNYWTKNSIDQQYGGFVGRINHFNEVVEKSPKGIILNSRILWTFSAASNHYQNDNYLIEANRAYNYLREYFQDGTNKGVFWEVNHLGEPLTKRKQTYAQAFTIYALSEYYKYSKNEEALSWALELFEVLEAKTKDKKLGGYIEAFDKDWKLIEDMRLSNKDLNAPKTMNTHLHILEAYTTLFEVNNNPKVGSALKGLIELFLEKFISENGHFTLFFSKDWKKLSQEASFGHDIETAWLLIHAARTLNDTNYIKKTEALSIKIADTFLKEALDKDFGVLNAINLQTNEIDYDKHWWPQAEAVVGLLYVWQITTEEKYRSTAKQIWNFIRNKIIDNTKGEWFFRVNREGIPYPDENKIGPWKCPYHNSRTCIEIIKQLHLYTDRKTLKSNAGL